MADENTSNENEGAEATEGAAEAVAEVEEAVEDAVAEDVAEIAEAVAEAEADVEEAVAAAEITAEEGAEIEAVIEEAAAEDIAEEIEAAVEIEEAVEVAAAAVVDEGTVPSGDSPQKKKKKRLPRAQRRSRSKPKRAQTGERKPLVRMPKPESERGRRQERQGTVVSDAMDKTIVVKVDMIKAHRRYKKVVRRSVKFHAHDESNVAKVGDIVRIVETRPLSATKRWRLAEVVEAAK